MINNHTTTCPATLKSILSKRDILAVSRCIIKPTPCEWDGCRVIMNCLHALTEHLFQHCAEVPFKDGNYRCNYMRCAGRTHSSRGQLKTHIQLSHLSRSSLPCPVIDCNDTFPRPSLLESHFQNFHQDLILKELPWSSDDFSLISFPSPPTSCPSPPPLPSILPSYTISHPVTVTTHQQRRKREPQTLDQLSRKWSRLDMRDDDEDDDDDGENIAFDDLKHPPRPRSSESPEPINVVATAIPPDVGNQLSRPQPIIHPTRYGVPPKSILYDAFILHETFRK
ncbi:hypothetical protein BJ138DRAFT_1143766 [Hygrophoropsis aurantiaca]|uniref:Uncharacterized protein n=1 Tax=Hygrophoropsis aurantiaca TaxID=72124 RepID=A0ACB8AMN9_9AGAM|nr:hypothetical protein BJ138DRAFT_1143766 [Hygrophoropsis aurantiaca]